jgi:hypothetical protein
MRDHWRILGTLFLVWAGVQAVGLVLGITLAPREPAAAELPSWWMPAAAVLTLVTIGLYVWCGVRLRQHVPQVRLPALFLSVLSLLSFPLGLALGAYGLWVLFRFREAPRPV